MEEQYRNRVIGMEEMESVDRTHRLIEYNERRSFEDAYEDFYRKNIKGSHDIDFIGINFSIEFSCDINIVSLSSIKFKNKISESDSI